VSDNVEKRFETYIYIYIYRFQNVFITVPGARGSTVGLGTALQVGRSRGSIPDGVTGIFH